MIVGVNIMRVVEQLGHRTGCLDTSVFKPNRRNTWMDIVRWGHLKYISMFVTGH